jgi:methionyl aminopeptidase
MIRIKSPEEIAAMRATCQLAARTLQMIAAYVQPGVTTQELNDRCHDYIVAHGAIPSPLNYRGFPRSICTSVNQQVCHGIPGARVLRAGDIVNVDITTNLDGWHGDTSSTFPVGVIAPKATRIIAVASTCMDIGIAEVRPGVRIGAIGAAIEAYARQHGCSVVREYCGHGIGRAFHEEPAILHYNHDGESSSRMPLRPGMIFTVEPMINLGQAAIRQLPDRWTVVTRDHSLSAQFEHTVLVTESGYEILTLPPAPEPAVTA